MRAGQSAPAFRRAFAPVRGEAVAAAGRKTVARQILRLWICSRTLAAAESAAAVHDWRVAGRRLRFALRLWSKWLGPAEKLRQDLGRLDRKLGRVRDRDILRRAAARLPGGRRLRAAWQQELLADRNRRLGQFLPGLQAADYRGLVLRLIGFVRKPRPAARRRRDAVEHEARRLLQKKARKLLRQSGRPAARFSDEDLHRLRIAFKKLRYACEFFAPYFPPAMLEFIRRWVRYQDCLGAHQDAMTVMALAWKWRDRRPAGMAPAAFQALLKALVKQEKERARAERRKFKKLWREFPAQAREFKMWLHGGTAASVPRGPGR